MCVKDLYAQLLVNGVMHLLLDGLDLGYAMFLVVFCFKNLLTFAIFFSTSLSIFRVAYVPIPSVVLEGSTIVWKHFWSFSKLFACLSIMKNYFISLTRKGDKKVNKGVPQVPFETLMDSCF